jgi:hypothetical protein
MKQFSVFRHFLIEMSAYNFQALSQAGNDSVRDGVLTLTRLSNLLQESTDSPCKITSFGHRHRCILQAGIR